MSDSPQRGRRSRVSASQGSQTGVATPVAEVKAIVSEDAGRLYSGSSGLGDLGRATTLLGDGNGADIVDRRVADIDVRGGV